MQKKIKLIAADMDGTLLNSENEFGTGFFSLQEKLKAEGILFAVASGRQYHNLRHRFESVAEDIIYIAENGGYVSFKGKELMVNDLDFSIALNILQEANHIPGLEPVFCGVDGAYTRCGDPEFLQILSKYFFRYEVVPDLTEVKDRILKVTLYDPLGAENHGYPLFQKFQPVAEVNIGSPVWVDICASNVNKGFAINKLQSYFGISPLETMVFGDFLNDLEMMDAGWYSYAMANAHPRLFENARFIAPSNDENGVIREIRRRVFHENV